MKFVFFFCHSCIHSFMFIYYYYYFCPQQKSPPSSLFEPIIALFAFLHGCCWATKLMEKAMNHFVLLVTLFLHLFDRLCYVNCGIYDGGKFYDKQNFKEADCIVRNEYIYLGKKSAAKDGITECENWKNVTNYHLERFKGYNQFYFVDEYLDHNYCRNIPLDKCQRDKKYNNATAHHYVQTDGWNQGPWCYVKVSAGKETVLWGNFTTEYTTMPCFEQCVGDPQNITTPPPPPKKNTTKYNTKLIENLAQNLFSNFDHGDKNYYESKPSDKNVSAEFESNAKIIFYVGMSLLILTVTVIFAKHYYSKWKKRPKDAKKEEKEPEKEKEEPVENNNEQIIEQGIKVAAELPNVSNENLNVPEIKAAEVPKASMSEDKPATSLPQKRKLRKR